MKTNSFIAFFIFVAAGTLAAFGGPKDKVFASEEDSAVSAGTVSAEEAGNAEWYKKTFPKGLIKAGQKSSAASIKHFEDLKGKFVGVYSSANWCGYCHYFTPQLVDFRKKHAKDFEVVFVSSDKSEAEMIKYMKKYKMKWFAMPHGQLPIGVKMGGGLPNLIVLAPDGSVLTEFGGASKEMQAKKPDPRLYVDLVKKMDSWKETHAKGKEAE